MTPLNIRDAQFRLHSRTKYVRYDLGSKLSKQLKHCGQPVLPTPLIVPPTWDKTANQHQLSPVWRAACKQLEEAENIFVMGYSLPITDSFFRFLYALGSEGPTELRNFWVFDPDSKVDQRFKDLIGMGMESKYKFHPMVFYDALHQEPLRRALEEP